MEITPSILECSVNESMLDAIYLVDVRHGHILFGEFPLALGTLRLLVLAFQDRLTVLVKLRFVHNRTDETPNEKRR